MSYNQSMGDICLMPSPDQPGLTRQVSGIDQEGNPVVTAVVEEKPLTLFLNGQEIVNAQRNGADHAGRASVSIPWRPLEFPNLCV